MAAHPFWVQNGPIALNKSFFRKVINIILMVALIMNFFKKGITVGLEL